MGGFFRSGWTCSDNPVKFVPELLNE